MTDLKEIQDEITELGGQLYRKFGKAIVVIIVADTDDENVNIAVHSRKSPQVIADILENMSKDARVMSVEPGQNEIKIPPREK